MILNQVITQHPTPSFHKSFAAHKDQINATSCQCIIQYDQIYDHPMGTNSHGSALGLLRVEVSDRQGAPCKWVAWSPVHIEDEVFRGIGLFKKGTLYQIELETFIDRVGHCVP